MIIIKFQFLYKTKLSYYIIKMKIIKYISDLHLERKIKNIKFKNKDLGGYLLLRVTSDLH